MHQFMLFFAAFAVAQLARADSPVDKWVSAVGGMDRLAAVQAFYREATIEVAGHTGTIRVWRMTDGKYRKEESIATYSLVETFDGANGMVRRGDQPPQEMSAAELARARSTAFANSGAVYFVAFPERRRGTVSIETDSTIVLRPEGGIDWRVALDPQSALPRTMIHQEGDRTITVTFAGYETVEGVSFEKEIHRDMGVPGRNSVIRFTKTIVNPPIDASFFTIQPGNRVIP